MLTVFGISENRDILRYDLGYDPNQIFSPTYRCQIHMTEEFQQYLDDRNCTFTRDDTEFEMHEPLPDNISMSILKRKLISYHDLTLKWENPDHHNHLIPQLPFKQCTDIFDEDGGFKYENGKLTRFNENEKRYYKIKGLNQ